MNNAIYFIFAVFYQLAPVLSVHADSAASYYYLDSFHPVAAIHQKPLLFPGAEKEGEWAFFSAASLSNTLDVRRGFYTVDAETRRLDMATKYAVSDTVQVGAQLPLNWRGSGFTDSWINSWHDTFNLNGGPRKRFENDDYEFSGVNSDYSAFDVGSKGTGFGNVQLSLEVQLDPLFTPVLALSLPGIDDDYSHRGLDFTVGLRSGTKLGSIELNAVVLFQQLGENDFQGMDLPASSFTGSLTAAMMLTDHVGAFAGYSVIQSLMCELNEANSYETYLDLGLTYRTEGATIYQFTVRENPGPQSNSVDISGVLSVRI